MTLGGEFAPIAAVKHVLPSLVAVICALTACKTTADRFDLYAPDRPQGPATQKLRETTLAGRFNHQSRTYEVPVTGPSAPLPPGGAVPPPPPPPPTGTPESGVGAPAPTPMPDTSNSAPATVIPPSTPPVTTPTTGSEPFGAPAPQPAASPATAIPGLANPPQIEATPTPAANAPVIPPVPAGGGGANPIVPAGTPPVAASPAPAIPGLSQ